MTVYTFTVPGIPRPQGDLKIGRVERDLMGRRVHLYMGEGVKSWRRDIGIIARSTIGIPIEGGVAVLASFTFEGRGRAGPHIQVPDADKLARAVLDALKGIAYEDDKQVTCLVARKRWGSPSGAEITVGPWNEVQVWAATEFVPVGV